MKCLNVTDEFHGLHSDVRNVSFAIHTRTHVALDASGATLRSDGKTLQLRLAATASPTTALSTATAQQQRAAVAHVAD